MIDISQIDYSKLDRPEVLMFLFHPRPEGGHSSQMALPRICSSRWTRTW